MSERNFEHSREIESTKEPNILEDFDGAVDAVMQIETVLSEPERGDKDIMRNQVGLALESLNSKLKHSNESDSAISNLPVTGFQGIADGIGIMFMPTELSVLNNHILHMNAY